MNDGAPIASGECPDPGLQRVARAGHGNGPAGTQFVLLGQVTLCPKGWPKFPPVPALPGLYRLDIGAGSYIGQTSNLKRRLQNYRRPAQDVQTENEIHDLIVSVGCAQAFVLTGDGLASEAERLAAERAAIKAASAEGMIILNKAGDTSPADRLRARIAFLEKMLAAARARLIEIDGP